eukprot:7448324-Alexandrium_andersonii.AAC.1
MGSAPVAPVRQANHPSACCRSPTDAPGQARRPSDGRRPPGLDEEGAPRGPLLVAERLCPRPVSYTHLRAHETSAHL